MRISDWSSDVCSSDLDTLGPDSAYGRRLRHVPAGRGQSGRAARRRVWCFPLLPSFLRQFDPNPGRRFSAFEAGLRKAGLIIDYSDRKSVVKGKSVSVRVDLGGRRIIKTKIQTNTKRNRQYQ